MSRKALTACTMPCVPAQIRTEPAQIRTGLQTAYHQRGSLSGMFERTPAAAPLVRQRATCSLSRPRLATSPPGRGRLSDRKNGRQVTTGLVLCGREAIILSSPRSSCAQRSPRSRAGHTPDPSRRGRAVGSYGRHTVADTRSAILWSRTRRKGDGARPLTALVEKSQDTGIC